MLRARRRAADRRARRRQPAAARVPQHPHVAREPAAVHRAAIPSGSPSGSARRRSRRRGSRGWSRSTPVVGGRSTTRSRSVNGDARAARELRRAARAARGAGLPARVLADRVARDQLPALLRRQHAGRAARRATRRSSTRRTSCSAQLLARRQRAAASASITRTGCSIRRATSRCCRSSPREPGAERATAGATAALRRRREDPVGPRAAAARAGSVARHDRLQLPQRAERPVRRPAHGAAHAPHLRQAHRPHASRSTTCSTRASG